MLGEARAPGAGDPDPGGSLEVNLAAAALAAEILATPARELETTTVAGVRLPPSGQRARAGANLRAMAQLIDLQLHERDSGELPEPVRANLAGWSGWGACPDVFDETRGEYAADRARLRTFVGDEEYAAAARSTLNAHYTDPNLAVAMWSIAGELGAASGRVLEPGCGAGMFIGLAPDGAQVTGVEVDPTTAAIAEALHPAARVLNRSFADPSRALDRGGFDLAIGNVPFGRFKLHDPAFNVGRHAIHNHFIIKSLALTKPGGYGIFLTSSFTLDAGSSKAREEMSELADLVGAVRLPALAHRRMAGTDVVTDLLVFRRREAGLPPSTDLAWLGTGTVTMDGGEHSLNQHYIDHSANVLGTLEVAPGRFGPRLTVTPSAGRDQVAATVAGTLERWAPALATRVATLPPAVIDTPQADVAAAPASTVGERAGTSPEPAETSAVQEIMPEAPEGLWDGHILPLPDGTFGEAVDGDVQPLDVPVSRRKELAALCEMRDQARMLLEHEAQSPGTEDTPDLTARRAKLKAAYDGYVGQYGPINAITKVVTKRTDPDTGEPVVLRRSRPAITLIRNDPFGALVLALESYDEDAEHAEPAALLTRRVLTPREAAVSADTPQEALAVCLDTIGRADLATIAGLLDTTEPVAREQLGELVFDDPDSGLVPAAEYLSGNVRQKLDRARKMAETLPDCQVNVAALEAVLPKDLGVDEVKPRLGAVWIGEDDHRDFLRHILNDDRLTIERAGMGGWSVQSGKVDDLRSRNTWGTPRRLATEIVKNLLEQRPVVVHDEYDTPEGGTRKVINAVETEAAQEKADAIQDRFAEWCFEDPARAHRLLTEYNRRFNSLVLRRYGTEGERLRLPGVAESFVPRPHQRAAVARMINEPAVGLFHDVGAGKTAEMIMGATELRRLGMIRKPVLVVPNHMLEQFTREWLQIYPQARVLTAGSQDLRKDSRQRFVARAAMNDWDGIVMTRTAFERIPLSEDSEKRYMFEQLQGLRDSIEEANRLQEPDGKPRRTMKAMEERLQRMETKIKEKRDGERDPAVVFEQTGIDYVIVDEAHEYKNLQTTSNIRDAAKDGSKRATDLDAKLSYLRSTYGGRVGTLATATPIANSVSEAHVMMRYLRPDILADAGVLVFDEWAATFGRTMTGLEVSPEGGGYRLTSRFAAFDNVPEMLTQWHVFADVQTAEDLQLPVPDYKQRRGEDGQLVAGPETVVVPPTGQLTAFMEGLAARAEYVRRREVKPDEDNMLKIMGEGRRAAVDMRLLDDDEPDDELLEERKIDRVVGRIAAIAADTAANTYTDPTTGEESPVKGALQIVFCDLGTPGTDKEWNVYDTIRAQLAARGIAPSEVRFVHEARNDADKARMFAAARDGHVRVLIGSTGKMGVGTNVQARAVALHHVDCPWRPADIVQREGRLLRQGNQNPEVEVLRYVTQRSLDAFMWQTVERKAKFISQIMSRNLHDRSIDDIGPTQLGAADVAASASGDPLVLELAQAEKDLQKYTRLEQAHGRGHRQLRDLVTWQTERREASERAVKQLDDALAQRVDTRGDLFEMTVGTETYVTRADAAAALHDWEHRNAVTVPKPVGEIGGHQFTGCRFFDAGKVIVRLDFEDVPVPAVSATVEHIRDSPLTLVQQLENRLRGLEAERDRRAGIVEDASRQAREATASLSKPFQRQQQLTDARNRVEMIKAKMSKKANMPPPELLEQRASEVREQEARRAARQAACAAIEDVCIRHRQQHAATRFKGGHGLTDPQREALAGIIETKADAIENPDTRANALALLGKNTPDSALNGDTSIHAGADQPRAVKPPPAKRQLRRSTLPPAKSSRFRV